MKLRKATRDDLKNFEDILNRVLEVGKVTGLNWTKNYPRKIHFEEDLKNDELYVLEDNKQIIGAVCLNDKYDINYNKINFSYSKRALLIHRLMIDGKFSNKGYGKKMIREIEKFALDNGYDSIKLDTNEKNKIAQKLYFGSGYIKKGMMNLEGKEGNYIALQKILK
ncbi:GNAT family N-acetyltransferase [Clostridium chrysemydis]|uniref:GNAT family N-acetyltransferase n=1 Tax=Clostridium chrysemydis TaxID=2665504 RepID=UPI0018845D9E|nr:GNAT family N-acetyltransferase [Clostridium chrysemydis]